MAIRVDDEFDAWLLLAAFCLPVVPSGSGSPTNVGEVALIMKDGEAGNLRPRKYHVSIEHELRRKVHPLT